MEFIVIGIIALIVLGPARLPEVARNVGRGMREFRAAISGATVSLDGGADDEDEDEEENEAVDDGIPEPDEPSGPAALPEGR